MPILLYCIKNICLYSKRLFILRMFACIKNICLYCCIIELSILIKLSKL